MQISGSKVLLTGATGGLGHAIARELRGRGADLVLTGRRVDVLEPLAAETAGVAVQADLAVRGDVERLISDHADTDILIANAALPASGHIHSFDTQEIDLALEVNLRAVMILAHALSAQMVRRGRGQVVLISSLAGMSGQTGSSVYSATKFALRGFAQSMRGDLRDANVGVSCIFPGFVRDAGMYADSGVKLPAWVGTSTPQQVSAAVTRAITRNRGEVVVAPLPMRVSAILAGIVPELAAAVARRAGGGAVSGSFAEGQRDKRR
ncbi:MAG TPA: SDR family NAD(P)-dependent oxidoreductase [Baekduia sp.]|nr:SDR family NAD(P)-dependent oxidoreductase [Baekduia sp.]